MKTPLVNALSQSPGAGFSLEIAYALRRILMFEHHEPISRPRL